MYFHNIISRKPARPFPVLLVFSLLLLDSSAAKVRKRQTSRPEPVSSTLETPPAAAVVSSIQEFTTSAPVSSTVTPSSKTATTTPNTVYQMTTTDKIPSNWYEAFGQAASFRINQAFQRLKTAVMNRIMPATSTARYMESFMEGAMVPMSFLLMAAFIMDILQRLFPLPYATFVREAYNRRGPTQQTPQETTEKPQDLTKFQVNTPLGNFGLETNDQNSIFGNSLFGRSNVGNPPVVNTNSGAYQNQNDEEESEANVDEYLNTLLQSQQEQVKSSLADAMTNAIKGISQAQDQGQGPPSSTPPAPPGNNPGEQHPDQNQRAAENTATFHMPYYQVHEPKSLDKFDYVEYYSRVDADGNPWRRRRK